MTELACAWYNPTTDTYCSKPAVAIVSGASLCLHHTRETTRTVLRANGFLPMDSEAREIQ